MRIINSSLVSEFELFLLHVAAEQTRDAALQELGVSFLQHWPLRPQLTNTRYIHYAPYLYRAMNNIVPGDDSIFPRRKTYWDFMKEQPLVPIGTS